MRFISSVFQFVYSRQFFVGVFFGYLTATAMFRVQSDFQLKNLDMNLLLNLAKNYAAPPLQLAPDEVETRHRILCWVVTAPSNILKADAVKNTWGQRCDKLLFMSSQNDSSLPAIGLPLPGPDSRSQLWNKAKLTFRYVHDNHLNDYDWFFKADDDTYALMENLRMLLTSFDPSEALFIGHQFGAGNHSFLSGGAGYVLSRETLRRLVEQGLDENKCPTHFKGQEDDVTITQCLSSVGVKIPATVDESRNHRFLSFDVDKFYASNSSVRCLQSVQPMQCPSRNAITFHYVSRNRMFLYEYLIYQLKLTATDDDV